MDEQNIQNNQQNGNQNDPNQSNFSQSNFSQNSSDQGSYQNDPYQNNQNQYNQNQYNPYQPPQPAPKQTNTLAIISLVLGILAILFGCCPSIFFMGIIFGIAGIVCAVISNKQSKSGLAIAGLVCSIVGIVLAIAMGALFILGYAIMSSSEFSELNELYQHYE